MSKFPKYKRSSKNVFNLILILSKSQQHSGSKQSPMICRFEKWNIYWLLAVFILWFWLIILFPFKTESESLVHSLTGSQSDSHKLYYSNHRKKKKDIIAYWFCMGYGRHCSTLKSRTNLYSTYNFLIGVSKHSSSHTSVKQKQLLDFKERRRLTSQVSKGSPGIAQPLQAPQWQTPHSSALYTYINAS